MNPAARFDQETEFHRCTPIVTRIARQFAARVPANVTFDDLMQAGLIGLLEASRRFDPEAGVPFDAYATLRIRGAMTDELRIHDWMPRQRRREHRQVEATAQRLAHNAGRPATEAEIAEDMGIAVAEVQAVIADADLGRPWTPAPDDNDEATPLDALFASEGDDPAVQCTNAKFRKDLAGSIAKLPERERLVMALYYEQDLNLREIAAVLDVTESRVCQIHRQAVERLQDALVAWREPATQTPKTRTRRAA